MVDRRPETRPSRRIEFAEHVVGQQHRTHAALLVKPRGLREPQCEDERALLAFGREIPGRGLFHHEAKVIAMRPGQRRPKLEIARPARLQPREQRLGGGLRKIRLVNECRRFRVVTEPGVGGLQRCLQGLQPGGAQRDQLRGGGRERLFKRVQLGVGRPARFQEGIPLRQRPRVGLQRAQVARVHRRQRQIEPAPPAAGRAAHEQQVLRGKNHRRKTPEVLRELRHARLIAPEFLALVPQLDRDLGFILPLMLDRKRDGRALFAVPDQQPVIGRAKRTQRGQKPRGLEQVGLSLPVRADQKMPAAGKFERGKADVAEMPEREFAQAHGAGSSE